MSPEKYPTPPIIDSVIELRFSEPLKVNTFKRVAKKMARNYAHERIEEEAEVVLRVEPRTVTNDLKNPRPVHTLSSDDQTDRVRFDPFKVFWSRLPPYENWEALEARLFHDLAAFPNSQGLPSLSRIGVRYRNRIDVPCRESDGLAPYEDYIAVNIGLPEVFDPHDGYMWKVVKHFREKKLSSTVASGTIDPEIPNTVAILLDIDVYGTEDLPNSMDALRTALSTMRDLKNEVFEFCITDKARESFR